MNDAVNTHIPAERLRQFPFDVAVVVVTILRPSLLRAVRSVYAQRFPGRVHVLVGVDKPDGDAALLEQIRAECPLQHMLTIVNLGYSTSARNGGLYPGACGGALRTILSYAANSRAVAYLDDDNWFGPDHLRTLRDALEGHDYAFSLRWFVERETAQPLCVDDWESVGPGAGAYRERFGGFIDPSSLMVDKLKCDEALRWWCFPLPEDASGMSEDRNIFNHLRTRQRGRGTGLATSFYVMNPGDCNHWLRLSWIGQKLGLEPPARPSTA